MKSEKVAQFIALAGQKGATSFIEGTPEQRKLGAQLLLSEVLEYCIKGLGVIPEVDGTPITYADGLTYQAVNPPSKLEMLDGLADVAYTMYWNAITFGVPLEEAYDLVCDNNLEKFVLLNEWSEEARPLERNEWPCQQEIEWPKEVAEVHVIPLQGKFYAVGRDKHGKVRKPSSYSSVDLAKLVE